MEGSENWEVGDGAQDTDGPGETDYQSVCVSAAYEPGPLARLSRL